MNNLLAMAARAGHVLGGNARSTDGVVKAAPSLYPHQWSWDTAFIAIGLAQVDASLARRNLDALFAAQWRNGMVPHIVFDEQAADYFPGPDVWACAELSPDAPEHPRTSGLCQPPVHAIAAFAILRAAEEQSAAEARAARSWLEGFFPRLLAWHRFLARERRDEPTGLLTIFHGWESGMDNSPRWDGPYSRVLVGPSLPAYQRRDTSHADPSTRPSDREYDRYLWLVEEARQARYNQAELAGSCSFRAGDAFFTAIFAAANDHLADLAEQIGAGGVEELRRSGDAARAAVLRQADPTTGLSADLDLRAGQRLVTESIAGFSPLVAGGAPLDLRKKLVAELLGPRWAGHKRLRWPVPPSTSPASADFRERSYWRGPTWPCMTWLLSWALRRNGEQKAAASLREAGLTQLEGPEFAEYYEPFSGEPLGSLRQSWTAAAALDWLADAQIPRT
jgi:glucosylglycerate hydrolase